MDRLDRVATVGPMGWSEMNLPELKDPTRRVAAVDAVVESYPFVLSSALNIKGSTSELVQ